MDTVKGTVLYGKNEEPQEWEFGLQPGTEETGYHSNPVVGVVKYGHMTHMAYRADEGFFEVVNNGAKDGCVGNYWHLDYGGNGCPVKISMQEWVRVLGDLGLGL